MKTLKPKLLTKKEEKFFGDDHKLKIIKQWSYQGKSYSARRDADGYIGIVDDEKYFGVGCASYDYCFLESDIDDLARRLKVMG